MADVGKNRLEGMKMIKSVAAALALGALAACVHITVNEAQGARPTGGADSCDAGLYGYLLGQDEASIDRRRLPKSFRIVCAECMVTQDFRPDRLSIHLGADKKVGSVRCG